MVVLILLILPKDWRNLHTDLFIYFNIYNSESKYLIKSNVFTSDSIKNIHGEVLGFFFFQGKLKKIMCLLLEKKKM